jgi:hypothetical protein
MAATGESIARDMQRRQVIGKGWQVDDRSAGRGRDRGRAGGGCHITGWLLPKQRLLQGLCQCIERRNKFTG